METGSLADTAKAVGKTEEDVRDIIKTANAKLWDHRSQARPKPHRDEKVNYYYRTLLTVLISLLSTIDLGHLEWNDDLWSYPCLSSHKK
jgi:hypothetical protein